MLHEQCKTISWDQKLQHVFFFGPVACDQLVLASVCSPFTVPWLSLLAGPHRCPQGRWAGPAAVQPAHSRLTRCQCWTCSRWHQRWALGHDSTVSIYRTHLAPLEPAALHWKMIKARWSTMWQFSRGSGSQHEACNSVCFHKTIAIEWPRQGMKRHMTDQEQVKSGLRARRLTYSWLNMHTEKPSVTTMDRMMDTGRDVQKQFLALTCQSHRVWEWLSLGPPGGSGAWCLCDTRPGNGYKPDCGTAGTCTPEGDREGPHEV